MKQVRKVKLIELKEIESNFIRSKWNVMDKLTKSVIKRVKLKLKFA